MKKIAFVSLLTTVALTACHRRHHDGHHHGHCPPIGEQTPYSTLIPIDTANKMISSYLESVNFKVNKDQQKAIIFDADSLRAYLADDRIRDIKFVFAHSLDYANKNYGVRPDTNSHVMTFIIAGFDEEGNYVYKDGEVYENGSSCPNHCPSGQAGSDLLPSDKQTP